MKTIQRILVGLILVACSATLSASDVFGLHKVEKVEDGGRVLITFNRLPVYVRLGHVQCTPEAKAKLEELIGGKTVALKYVDELGAHESGDPYVYILMGAVNVNVKLVELGAATYDTSVAKSKLNDADFAKAQKAHPDATVAKPPVTPPTPGGSPTAVATPAKAPPPAAAPAGGQVCAELRGSFYHLATCKKAQQLSANSRILFASYDAAEKGGKRPCWSCLPDRAEAAAFGGHDSADRQLAVKVGPLIGLKSNPKLFFSPTAPALSGVDVADMIGFKTLAEAKASGREPDMGSLRLTAPPGEQSVPPKDGECIGRSPPFFRPCYRAPADESGLCTVCQGRE